MTVQRFENPPYYITAYGLAVKRGFKGTLDEWLASLRGNSCEIEVRATETGYELEIISISGEDGTRKSENISIRQGFTPKFKIGTVETLVSGSSASVEAVNLNENTIGLTFGIPRGKSAYEYARDGGYIGTEEEFAELLAGSATQEWVTAQIQAAIRASWEASY